MQLDEYRLHGNADRISTGNIEIPSHIQIWPNKNGHKKYFTIINGRKMTRNHKNCKKIDKKSTGKTNLEIVKRCTEEDRLPWMAVRRMNKNQLRK